MTTTLYYHPIYIRPIVAMCLAEYFKADIQNVDINTVMGEFTKDFPLHQCPSLINKETGLYLTETISIQHYIIKAFCKDPEEVKKLLGSTILEQSEILRWDAFSVSDFLNREVNYVEPLIGMMPYDADTHPKAKEQFDVAVQIFEDHLKNHQFLVGDHVTLADLSGVSSFFLGFNYAFDENWSHQYPSITRWYKEVTKSPYVSNFFEGKEQAKTFPQPPK
ncbi:glutathione S-transferase Y-2 [Monosporozyma servazzii]